MHPLQAAADQDWAVAFTTVADFPALHRLVTATARALADADGATFVVRDRGECFYVAEDSMAPLWAGQRFPLTECISGWAMLHDGVAVVPDVQDDPRVPFEAYRPTFARSLLMVPVPDALAAQAPAAHLPPQAAIGAYWRNHHRATDTQVEALRRLAHATSRALARLGVENAPWAPRFRPS